jgi:phosphoribosylcarboxyaminoimidazole (NCAIR) mutase
MVTPITPIEIQHRALAPLDAMKIVATQREQLHEKILRLRALREASEANAKDQEPS